MPRLVSKSLSNRTTRYIRCRPSPSPTVNVYNMPACPSRARPNLGGSLSLLLGAASGPRRAAAPRLDCGRMGSALTNSSKTNLLRVEIHGELPVFWRISPLQSKILIEPETVNRQDVNKLNLVAHKWGQH